MNDIGKPPPPFTFVLAFVTMKLQRYDWNRLCSRTRDAGFGIMVLLLYTLLLLIIL